MKNFETTVIINGNKCTFTRSSKTHDYSHVIVWIPDQNTDAINPNPQAKSWAGSLALAEKARRSFQNGVRPGYGHYEVFSCEEVVKYEAANTAPQMPTAEIIETLDNAPTAADIAKSEAPDLRPEIQMELAILVSLGKTKVTEFEALQQECHETKTPYALKIAQKRRASKAAEISTLCEVAVALHLAGYDQFAEIIHS